MVLSDRDIRAHIASGKIRLTPPIDFETQLGSCSIDLRLGNVFNIFDHSKFPYIDLRNGVDVDQVMRQVTIDDGETFVLHPGQFVLGMTKESMELAPDLLARLEGRSSLGRLGIIVHGTASVFDPGWNGHPTLELGNVGIIPVGLYPGMRICSFTFETLSSPAEVPYGKRRASKYVNQAAPLASKIMREER
jgi:dCTP deaminase